MKKWLSNLHFEIEIAGAISVWLFAHFFFVNAWADDRNNCQLILKAGFYSSQSEVYLDDVAEFNLPSSTCKDLGGIRLLTDVDPGFVTKLDRKSIEGAVAQESPGLNISWSGASATQVIGIERKISSSEVEKHLNQYLIGVSQNWQSVRFELKRIKLMEHLRARDDQFELRFPRLENEISEALRLISDHVGGWLQLDGIVLDEDYRQDFRLNVQIEVELKRSIAARDLPRGKILEEADVGTGWTKLRRGWGASSPDAKDFVGNMLTRNMRAGEFLSASHVKKPIVIERGKIVKVRVGQPGMSLTGDAKALEPGSQGDEIEVQVSSTKKKMMARVIDSETVEGRF